MRGAGKGSCSRAVSFLRNSRPLRSRVENLDGSEIALTLGGDAMFLFVGLLLAALLVDDFVKAIENHGTLDDSRRRPL